MTATGRTGGDDASLSGYPCGIPGCHSRVQPGDATHWRKAHSLHLDDLAEAFATIDTEATR